MISDHNAPHWLGAAYLIVLVVSAVSGVLMTSAVGSGTTSEMLISISERSAIMRLSILIELVTSVGIVVLAALLYVVLRDQNRIVALVALGWWWAEAITLAVGKLGSLALIPLSMEFVSAGAPEASHYQALGSFLYDGLDRQGNEIHMVFFCLGGLLWYSLFFKSRIIPRLLSAWGVASVCVAFVGTAASLAGVNVSILFFAHIALFELTIGLWLLFKGADRGATHQQHATVEI